MNRLPLDSWLAINEPGSAFYFEPLRPSTYQKPVQLCRWRKL